MPWTTAEERKKYAQLHRLYIVENRTVGEISSVLGIAVQTVFQRMMRLGIPSAPERKEKYIAKRRGDITIPKRYSSHLAEFFGIMLGDGSLSHYQAVVTLGTKEQKYAEYVVRLMEKLFSVRPKIGIRKNGYKDVYLGSTELTAWLQQEGLVYNKVRAQVDIPRWICAEKLYTRHFLRGFFDTDGSVYRLKFGIQASFTNYSAPLLHSAREGLIQLGYHPSSISAHRIYLTKRSDVMKFFKEIAPANPKHRRRFEMFREQIWAGSPVGSGARL